MLDEQTRLNIEALFARTDRDRLAEAKQQAIDPLPAAAGAQAAELLEQYDNYQQAQRQAYPPGVAPPTEEAALAELDGCTRCVWRTSARSSRARSTARKKPRRDNSSS